MGAMSLARGFFSRNGEVFALGLAGNLLSSLGNILAGITLSLMTDTLELLPGLMVLIPPAIGMRGNIFGALGSRLGTAMHLGTFEMSLKKGSLLRQNLEASIILSLIMSFLMGILAKIVSDLTGLGGISTGDFVFISVLGGMLAGFVLVFINIIVAYIGFKRNWDIDNFSAPIVTAAGDIVTLPMLFLSATIVLNVPDLAVDLPSFFFLALTAWLVIKIVRRGVASEKRILLESVPILTFCAALDIGAGVTIEHNLEELVALPALLVLIPPFLAGANGLGGILTSRISSLLHMGLVRPKKFPGSLEIENFMIIYVFAVWVFMIVGVFAHLVAELIGLSSPGLWNMVLLSLTAGVLTVTILNIISYYVAMMTFHFSLDPDTHSIPLTSSSIDFFGAAFLMSVIVLLGLG